ncbi:hypothetical protein [Pseudohaliea rubra]|uniref:Lipoprotein n=1 Tax=Pseudohaliea rubra DSM 19751 TaxID=1265313 RepID=A0A095VSF0_9GAMM|nr:hypothetical protein [Pseudohaliea rubra]KGE04295.1 hypothetical protein HRUBRA_01159 [Pseudohaliea rubra DSM 19751]
MKRLLLLLCIFSLAGCATGTGAPSVSEAAEPTPAWPPAPGAVTLDRAGTPPAPALDVIIEVFDTGLAEAAAGPGEEPVFAAVRKAEAFYMPLALRQALVESGHWGAVRVAPRASDTAALSLSGRIVHSDGVDLVLALRAVDATGSVWLEREYHDRAAEEDYPVAAGKDPFGDLYRQVANDLAAAQRARAVAELPAVALLRYAGTLAPGVFGDYLSIAADGQRELRRAPAEGDPMLARVRRLRNQEYLFIDAADEQYGDLVERFAPTYHLWRQYAHELARYETDYLARVGEREINARRGTYAAMQQTYGRFRRVKIHEQDLEELAEGFDNEVTETVIDVDDRVYRLSGSLATQYGEWREILRRIFTLEGGGVP